MAFIRKSFFNGESILRSATRAPTHRVIRGIPTRVNGTTEHLAAFYSMLVVNEMIPPDANKGNNDAIVAEMCLGAINITVEDIPATQPKKTFRGEVKVSFNSVDEDNDMKKFVPFLKQYTSDDDPIYQLDQRPDRYIQNTRSRINFQNSTNKKVLIFLASEIAKLNFNSSYSGHYKLKQFAVD